MHVNTIVYCASAVLTCVVVDMNVVC